MNLKQIIKNVKNYIKMSAKCESFLEIFDVENNSVIFDIPTIDDLQVGVTASPDGEYLFSDGMKVTIKDGLVAEVVKPEPEIIEEPIVEEPIAEEILEDEITKSEESTEEIVEEPIVEEPQENKDEKIAELESKISELEAQVAELVSSIEKKDAEIKEAEEEIMNIKDFYVQMNKPQAPVSSRIVETEGLEFSFKRK